MNFVTRSACRICTGDLVSLGSLTCNGRQPFVNDFPDSPDKPGFRCPLELVRCTRPDCGLVQLGHTAPDEMLFREHYWYRSGLNPVVVADLEGIAQQALSLVPVKPGDIFLDIGANDGTLLQFVPRTLRRVAVEPAKNLQEPLLKVADTVIPEFWGRAQAQISAKIITAIGMLYDMEDPNAFVAQVRDALDPAGVFIAECMTVRPMIDTNDVGNICHEHLEYFSYTSLRFLFEKNGLEIFRVEENSMNGGSYRLFARHHSKRSVDHSEPPIDFNRFFRTIEENRMKTVEFIRNAKHVYGYGASTKGNTILQYYDLNAQRIDGIADKDPNKWGRYTVATNIPIVSEEEARRKAQHFFVLPWAFLPTFLEREREWRRKGGKFIVCTPRFEVL